MGKRGTRSEYCHGGSLSLPLWRDGRWGGEGKGILHLFSPPFLPILLWRDGRWGGKDGMIPHLFLFSVSSPDSSLVQWEMGRKRWGDSPPFLSPLPHSSPVDIYSPPPSSPLFPRIRTINSSLAVGEGEGACNLKVKWPITACNFCNRRSFFLANLQVSGVVGTPFLCLPSPASSASPEYIAGGGRQGERTEGRGKSG